MGAWQSSRIVNNSFIPSNGEQARAETESTQNRREDEKNQSYCTTYTDEAAARGTSAQSAPAQQTDEDGQHDEKQQAHHLQFQDQQARKNCYSCKESSQLLLHKKSDGATTRRSTSTAEEIHFPSQIPTAHAQKQNKKSKITMEQQGSRNVETSSRNFNAVEAGGTVSLTGRPTNCSNSQKSHVELCTTRRSTGCRTASDVVSSSSSPPQKKRRISCEEVEAARSGTASAAGSKRTTASTTHALARPSFMRDEDLHLHQKHDDEKFSSHREKTASKRNFGSTTSCENNCSKNHVETTCYFLLGAAPANDEDQNYDCEDEESECRGDVVDHDLAYEADAEGDEAAGAEEEDESSAAEDDSIISSEDDDSSSSDSCKNTFHRPVIIDEIASGKKQVDHQQNNANKYTPKTPSSCASYKSFSFSSPISSMVSEAGRVANAVSSIVRKRQLSVSSHSSQKSSSSGRAAVSTQQQQLRGHNIAARKMNGENKLLLHDKQQHPRSCSSLLLPQNGTSDAGKENKRAKKKKNRLVSRIKATSSGGFSGDHHGEEGNDVEMAAVGVSGPDSTGELQPPRSSTTAGASDKAAEAVVVAADHVVNRQLQHHQNQTVVHTPDEAATGIKKGKKRNKKKNKNIKCGAGSQPGNGASSASEDEHALDLHAAASKVAGISAMLKTAPSCSQLLQELHPKSAVDESKIPLLDEELTQFGERDTSYMEEVISELEGHVGEAEKEINAEDHLVQAHQQQPRVLLPLSSKKKRRKSATSTLDHEAGGETGKKEDGSSLYTTASSSTTSAGSASTPVNISAPSNSSPRVMNVINEQKSSSAPSCATTTARTGENYNCATSNTNSNSSKNNLFNLGQEKEDSTSSSTASTSTSHDGGLNQQDLVRPHTHDFHAQRTNTSEQSREKNSSCSPAHGTENTEVGAGALGLEQAKTSNKNPSALVDVSSISQTAKNVVGSLLSPALTRWLQLRAPSDIVVGQNTKTGAPGAGSNSPSAAGQQQQEKAAAGHSSSSTVVSSATPDASAGKTAQRTPTDTMTSTDAAQDQERSAAAKPVEIRTSAQTASANKREQEVAAPQMEVVAAPASPALVLQQEPHAVNSTTKTTTLHENKQLLNKQKVLRQIGDFPLPKERYKKSPKCKEFVDNFLRKLLSNIGKPYNLTMKLGTQQDIVQLLKYAHMIVQDQPMFLELEAPINIVGDIHGQYQDLIQHFINNGFPPTANYLFLGDYVDRGQQSLETMCLLMCYKIKYPENFFILRGNHECAYISKLYGFHDECKRKYSVKLWREFTQFFKWLPVAATVGEKIFCAHGGLSTEMFTAKDHVNVPGNDSDEDDLSNLSDEDSDSSSLSVDLDASEAAGKNMNHAAKKEEKRQELLLAEKAAENAEKLKMKSMKRHQVGTTTVVSGNSKTEIESAAVWPSSPVSPLPQTNAADSSPSAGGSSGAGASSSSSQGSSAGEELNGDSTAGKKRPTKAEKKRKKKLAGKQLVQHVAELLMEDEQRRLMRAASPAVDAGPLSYPDGGGVNIKSTPSTSEEVGGTTRTAIADEDEDEHNYDKPCPKGWRRKKSVILPDCFFYQNVKTGEIRAECPPSIVAVEAGNEVKNGAETTTITQGPAGAGGSTTSPKINQENASSSPSSSEAELSPSRLVTKFGNSCLTNRMENLSEKKILTNFRDWIHKEKPSRESVLAVLHYLRETRHVSLDEQRVLQWQQLAEGLANDSSTSNSSCQDTKARTKTKSTKTFLQLKNTPPPLTAPLPSLPSKPSKIRQIMDQKLPNRPTEIPEHGMMCDILWSDPDPNTVFWRENERGVSFCFGQNVVDAFCKKYNMDLVCRAHQAVSDGYWFFARKKVVTVFSAPDYCGEMQNDGAVLSVSKDLSCKFKVLKSNHRQESMIRSLHGRQTRQFDMEKLLSTGELEYLDEQPKKKAKKM